MKLRGIAVALAVGAVVFWALSRRRSSGGINPFLEDPEVGDWEDGWEDAREEKGP